mmetsp:Transcript_40457/g.81604  ORF Transcript_40457/g.81604 Transcript_40457/m.81604 type:complete len:218 (+) Transcript_40457:32-685(+)
MLCLARRLRAADLSSRRNFTIEIRQKWAPVPAECATRRLRRPIRPATPRPPSRLRCPGSRGAARCAEEAALYTDPCHLCGGQAQCLTALTAPARDQLQRMQPCERRAPQCDVARLWPRRRSTSRNACGHADAKLRRATSRQVLHSRRRRATGHNACSHANAKRRNATPHSSCAHGVGVQPAATHAAMQTPSAALHATIAGATPAPAVTVPNVAPAAA